MKRIVAIAGLILGVTVFYTRTGLPESYASDLLIYSYNRPAQLYALLESVQKYMSGLGEISVLYRADGAEFEKGYSAIKTAFKNVHYYKQGDKPQSDFKPLTIEIFKQSPSAYILFAVDDIIVKDYVDVQKCCKALSEHKSYGFYLRCGKNLTENYPLQRKQPIPPLQQEKEDIFSWQFAHGKDDWAYPHTVDMTIYKKDDIEHDIVGMAYYSPNSFEDMWNRRSWRCNDLKGLCFERSKIVNLPLNRVQHEYQNRVMAEYSSHDLLTIFLKGLKIDIEPLYLIDNKAAHMEYSPLFIARS